MASVRQPPSFSHLLRQHRLDAGLTQEALAERAGLSVRAIQHLERALGQPQRETARRLADALALTADRRRCFEQAAAPTPRRRRSSASTVVSTQVAGDAPAAADVASPVAGEPGGERKHVTVLFADVAGLTDSTEGFDPDLADRLLADGVRLLTDVTHRYEGTVTWVRGDGIMALFGAPLAHEDHAVRACYAALAMHEVFRDHAEAIAGAHGIRLALSLGIDSGEVVVRAAGNDLTAGYTAMGPAVRSAMRLEQRANGGTALLSAETARLAEGHIEVCPWHSGADSGAANAFELTGVRPAQSRFQRVVQTRRLTRFVGRDAELASLALPLQRAAAGHGQIVGVVGEPGIGKSRLVWEAHRSGSWHVLETGADSYGTATSYLPVIDLLRSYGGVDTRDDPVAVQAKLTARVSAPGRALESELPALLALLDVPVDDPDWLALDPPERRRRTLTALKNLLLRESQAQPLLLIVEDLHWIDSETQALLDSLVESLPAARLLLLVSYRPEYEHRWGRKSYYTQLNVDALPAANAEALLSTLVGDDLTLRPLRRLVVERTGGNPLFLEETVRTLFESGALIGEHGNYRLARPIDEIRVPTTVQTVLSARIDRLEPGVKRLLQRAAVIGRDVPYTLLKTIAELPEAALQEALASLRNAELLYEARLFPELEFTFKHALTHQVAYDSLLGDRRRTIHARVVEAIEQLSADRQTEEVERLAYHATQGEVWEKALIYGQQAGHKAALRSAHQQAAASFDRALTALHHLPETPETRRQAIDIRLELRSSLYPLGQFDRIIGRLREAQSIAESLGDRLRLARVLAYLSSVLFTTGHYEAAIETAERTSVLGEVDGDLGARILGHHYRGLAYHSLGRYDRAIDLLTWNVETLTGDLLLERFGLHGVAAVFSLSPLLWSLAERGEFGVALRRVDDQLQIAEASDHPYTRVAASIGAGLVLLRLGDLPRAIAVAERGVELCRTWDNRALFPVIAAQLGFAYSLSGRVQEGIAMLLEAVEAGDTIKATMNHALAVGWLGEALLLAGRPTDAAIQATRSLELARHRQERGAEAWALRLHAEIESQQGSAAFEQAIEAYRLALALAETLGMRPLQAHCSLGLGRLLGKVGRTGAAEAAVQHARDQYRALGMPHWLTHAEAGYF